MRILFLYTELADYTISCLRALRAADKNLSLFVIHYPVNPEAPFVFDLKETGKFSCIEDFKTYNSLRQSIDGFDPQKIVCCGWINKWYVRISLAYRNKAICILTLDNHWNNSLRQQILRMISAVSLRRIFRKVWVPGEPQVEYAKKMGFCNKEILKGFYSCDLQKFNDFFERYREGKKANFPHRFLCVARYIPAKGYKALWEAFAEWKDSTHNDWELWCAGTGEQFSERLHHPAIKHLGFVQGEDWNTVVRETGVFVLGSFFEPWGVVVHEFAASGYPLLVSEKVGATSAFLLSENGFLFEPGNKQELIDQFITISGLTDHELYSMGEISSQLAGKISPAQWAERLLTA